MRIAPVAEWLGDGLQIRIMQVQLLSGAPLKKKLDIDPDLWYNGYSDDERGHMVFSFLKISIWR